MFAIAQKTMILFRLLVYSLILANFAMSENVSKQSFSDFVKNDIKLSYADLEIMYIYIIAGSSGGVVFIVLLVVILWCFCCKKSDEQIQQELEMQKNLEERNKGAKIINNSNVNLISLQKGKEKENENSLRKNELDITAAPINIEERSKIMIEKQSENLNEFKEIINKTNDVTVKVNLHNQILKNNENGNESYFTEQSMNKVNNNAYNSEDFRSNPNESYYQNININNQEEDIEEDPKLKDIKIVVKDNNDIDLEMSRDIEETILKNTPTHKTDFVIGENMHDPIHIQGELYDIKVTQQQTVFVNLLEKINIKEKAMMYNIDEFKKAINSSEVQGTKKITIKDQLQMNLTNKNLNTYVTEETHQNLPVLNKLEQQQDGTDISMNNIEGNYDSKGRDEPNNSFFNESRRIDEVPEEEPKFEEVELEDEVGEDSDDIYQTNERNNNKYNDNNRGNVKK